MQLKTVRNYSKIGDAIAIPDLVEVQKAAYGRFLQSEKSPESRDPEVGLEMLLREVFPIESYDGTMRLEYLHYRLDEPRYTAQECKELRLSYGMPFRIGIRFVREDKKEMPEEEIYLGEMPVLLGGGEFIVNGAERAIVNQLHRSPGVDFSIASDEGDRPLHSARIIPERGSWIELEVSKKDVLHMRIDQSTKIPATVFLRAIDEKFSSTRALIEAFYGIETLDVKDLAPERFAATPIVNSETGEEIVAAGGQVGDQIDTILASGLKTVEVAEQVDDELILNTIADENLHSIMEDMGVAEYEAALLALYLRLRPGNPPQVDKAKDLFAEKFFDSDRYRLGKVGRFRTNRKFNLDVPENEMTLRPEDFLHIIRYMLDLRAGRNKAHVDDIDHLGNRRLRTVDELAVEELRRGFLKLRRTVQERMSTKDPEELEKIKIADLVNSKSISSAVDHFFGRSELSQVVDQTNPISQLTHERRLSALGPGGLNRKRAGFEVRDVHISHYGRICPIETPEGTNIGLISSLGIYSRIDEYGFLTAPYRQIENGRPGEVRYLRADEELKATLAPTDVLDESGKLREGPLLARVDGEVTQVTAGEIDYIDVSPKQIVGVSAALIPFLEHDDANRALMGSNMQRQAVPLVRTDPPCVATGMEKEIPKYSGMVVRARNGGVVTHVDAKRIVIDNADEYELEKFRGLNEKTCQNQKPIVALGQKVEAGQILADGAACHQGELALGANVLVAFNTFDGYNFEDAIVMSDRMVKDDVFTSVHIDEFDVEIRETKLGREEFTRDIPNVSEKMLSQLDENGIIRTGAYVQTGDILVGKVSPKSKSELSPEEKLLHAIFGRAGEDVKNDSLEVPAGTSGIVIGAKRFSRRMHMTDEQKEALQQEIAEFEEAMARKTCDLFRQMVERINEVTGTELVDPSTRQKAGASDLTEVVMEQVESFSLKWVKGSKAVREEAEKIYNQFWPRIEKVQQETERRIGHMKRGDELPSGVLEMVKIYLATRRQIAVGDKMAGRHGNKGVIARIVPQEDMPFLEDGTPVDVLLNPLGVPSRMNVGQILETHLGWACGVLGFQAVNPVFDAASEDEVHEAIAEANDYVANRIKQLEKEKRAPGPGEILVRMPPGGKVQLYDGRTGEPFDQKTTVGYMYLIKLHHLVDEKIHARATGPYSLITQQPLGGKARIGGQRFGEMEVWALEAYGAAYVLQELLTVKSDDVEGRTKIYESMVKGNNRLEAGMPVAFDVLCNEIKGLGFNITMEKADSEATSIL